MILRKCCPKCTNIAQPIFLRQNQNIATVEKSIPELCSISGIFNKLAKEMIHLTCENSPNLVALLTT
jgi:hypothetical protein